MKKIRYLPFGYTIRNGHTVIEQQEADIVRNIFKAYIQGASLKEIAENLTAKKIPYTERTCAWDKARISRILENAKYTGDEEFGTIIDESTYEEAAAVKSARRWNQAAQERVSGRSATVSAADNAVRRCFGISIPNERFGKAGHAAMQTVAFGCGSATASCSGKSRSL